jgi:hypothetical protein
MSTADHPRPLPLINAKAWAIGFLVFSILLTLVFALTMPDFFRNAYPAT